MTATKKITLNALLFCTATYITSFQFSPVMVMNTVVSE
eukprot:CAMPEP_0180661590 /NCGR_PEP_ID=MMETSP1037_2-20121125/58925_1 /TAXON_ID=632150 /ORGANISM="Azadinium spinosum, Strain 3D9" /LENGTH=37 /DNA_ID= /DNA_START= /DNA_END= /DNA_ORIENTATION=